MHSLLLTIALVLLTASSFAQEKEKAAPRGGDFRLGALQRSLKEGLTTTEVFEMEITALEGAVQRGPKRHILFPASAPPRRPRR